VVVEVLLQEVEEEEEVVVVLVVVAESHAQLMVYTLDHINIQP